jgi:hypothetical protein
MLAQCYIVTRINHQFEIQIVQELSKQNEECSVDIYDQVLDLVQENPSVVDASLTSDEAHFRLAHGVQNIFKTWLRITLMNLIISLSIALN